MAEACTVFLLPLMIIRTVRKETFTPICNDLLNDPCITFKAKGLLCYLISRPPNWNVSVVHLSNTFKEGRDAIYSIITELEEAGYIVRFRIKDDKGRHLSIEYHVYETKQVPQTEIPKMEVPNEENPDTNKERALITKESNNESTTNYSKKNEMPIRNRKITFLKMVIDWIAENPSKYPKLMYNEFAKYWIERSISTKKIKLRFEDQPYFEIGRRLGTWFKNVKPDVLKEYWEQEANTATVNDLFKKLL